MGPSTASTSTEVPFTFHTLATSQTGIHLAGIGPTDIPLNTIPAPPYYQTIGPAEIRALPPIT
jgi:hypothetical protein